MANQFLIFISNTVILSQIVLYHFNSSFTEFVELYVDYLLNTSIYAQFSSFYYGFHSVCASNALTVSNSSYVFDHVIVCVCVCLSVCLFICLSVCLSAYVQIAIYQCKNFCKSKIWQSWQFSEIYL